MLIRINVIGENNTKVSKSAEGVTKRRVWLALLPALLVVAVLWVAFVVDFSGVGDFNFSRLGVYPLRLEGLWGVVTSPLAHASLKHLFSNSVPLVILLTLLFFFYGDIALGSLVGVWLLSGVLTWLMGRSAYHIGASGVVFGLVFFLFFSGLIRRYIRLAAVSMVVAFLYGSMVWSMLPVTEYVDVSVSWEAHLAGAISGLVVALVVRRWGPQKPEEVWEEEDEDEEVMGGVWMLPEQREEQRQEGEDANDGEGLSE